MFICAAKVLHEMSSLEFKKEDSNDLYVLASSVMSVTLFNDSGDEISYQDDENRVQIHLQLKVR